MITTFWILFIIIFYTYIGYGLIIISLVKIRPHSQKKSKKNQKKYNYPDVSLIIAAYNEQDTVQEKMDNCNNIDYPEEKLFIYWVTDGSDDKTNELLSKYKNITVLFEKERRGKTAAINRAMPFIKTPLSVFTDANTMINRESVKEIVKKFSNPQVGCVAGEKRVITDKTGNATAGEGIYWKYESVLKKYDDKFYSTMGTAGELYGIRTDLFEMLPADTLLDDFMLSMKIAKKGYKIAYCDTAYALEKPSLNMKEEEKRKIRISAGGLQSVYRLRSLLNIFKYRTLSFQYISHRVLRWTITPVLFFLLLPLNAIILIENPHDYFFILFLLLQIIFYILAATGYFFSKKNIKKKSLYIPYYFMFMNISVFKGILYLAANKNKGIWDKAKRK